MTQEAKISMLKTILDISGTGEDSLLTTYLNSSSQALLSWKYEYVPNDKRPTEVPADEEQNQIWAVVAGYSQRGNEAQSGGSENGISRQWAYADMLQFIKTNVIPMVGVI